VGIGVELNTMIGKTLISKIKQSSFWLSFLLILVQVLLWQKIKFDDFLLGKINLWDFDIYWQGAVDIMKGFNLYEMPYMVSAGPPLVYAPFLFFYKIPLNISRSIITILSSIAIGWSSWRLSAGFSFLEKKSFWREIGLNRFNIFLLLQLCLWIAFPTRFSLLLGQVNLILMLAVTYLLTTKSSLIKGALSGILIIFKTNFLILFVAMIFKKSHRKSFLIGLATIGVGLLFSINWIKPDFYRYYFTHKSQTYISASVPNNHIDYYNQSLSSTFNRLNLNKFYLSFWMISVIGGAVWLIKTQDLESGIILSVLLSPVSWSHYVVVFYPILIGMFSKLVKKGFPKTKKDWLKWILLIASAFLLSVEIKSLHQQQLTLFSGILASHYLIGGVMLMALQVYKLYEQKGNFSLNK
jgi:hypothetical protein